MLIWSAPNLITAGVFTTSRRSSADTREQLRVGEGCRDNIVGAGVECAQHCVHFLGWTDPDDALTGIDLRVKLPRAQGTQRNEARPLSRHCIQDDQIGIAGCAARPELRRVAGATYLVAIEPELFCEHVASVFLADDQQNRGALADPGGASSHGSAAAGVGTVEPDCRHALLGVLDCLGGTVSVALIGASFVSFEARRNPSPNA